MNDSGVYIGAVVELYAGLVTVESRYKTCANCDSSQWTGDFCAHCGKKLVPHYRETLCDYQQFLSNEDMFYELPVREKNAQGIVYLASNMLKFQSKLNISDSPVSLTSVDMDGICKSYRDRYKDELARLTENGFKWYIRYMAIEWAEY